MNDVKKPVRTRDGCNARIVATDLRNRNGDNIMALITPPDAHYEFPRSYQPDGRYVVGEIATATWSQSPFSGPSTSPWARHKGSRTARPSPDQRVTDLRRV